MSLLLRSWNLFHGNAHPPERRNFIEEMVRLATRDRPTVLFLQEVPAWALQRLAGWSGMAARGDVAARPRLGPIPTTPQVGRALTGIHPGRLRSAFAGQANAILLDRSVRTLSHDSITLNSRSFRRAQSRWLTLPPITRWAWAKERRVCQAVRVRLPDGRGALLANLHATGYRPDERLADAELLRAAVFADALAAPDDICVLAGDLNARIERSRTLADLASDEWGFAVAGDGIDHVLVRGARAEGRVRWPRERRGHDGRILSDHAPVEITIR